MRFHRGLRRASCFVRYADANPAKRAAREGWWARESSHRSRKPLKSFGRIAKPAADTAQIRTLRLNDNFHDCQTLRCPMTDTDWGEIIEACLATAPAQSVVYFVQTGKMQHVKIGFTRNLEQRLRDFETSSLHIELLASIPGGRKEETKIHRRLASTRVGRTEFFHFRPRRRMALAPRR